MVCTIELVSVDETYDEARGWVTEPAGIVPVASCGWRGEVERFDPAGESMEARVYAMEAGADHMLTCDK